MSRTLDDLAELMFPAAIAIGGLYSLWWITRIGIEELTVDLASQLREDTAAGFNDLSEWVDDQIYTPSEMASDIKSGVSDRLNLLGNIRKGLKRQLIPGGLGRLI